MAKTIRTVEHFGREHNKKLITIKRPIIIIKKTFKATKLYAYKTLHKSKKRFCTASFKFCKFLV